MLFLTSGCRRRPLTPAGAPPPSHSLSMGALCWVLPQEEDVEGAGGWRGGAPRGDGLLPELPASGRRRRAAGKQSESEAGGRCSPDVTAVASGCDEHVTFIM
ncbi:unnamed protein product [Pleuronectes platessa]|uniref:Uncharacterized protein n=1 Tax=Pleuronectes platessa TaxID=8262 RepID=A0A9N7V112_PLEPL|nr:unnamed protein product [Pleuronectes platessa]